MHYIESDSLNLFPSSLLSRHNLERFEFQKEYFPETFPSFPRNHLAGNYFSGNFFSVPLSSAPGLSCRVEQLTLYGRGNEFIMNAVGYVLVCSTGVRYSKALPELKRTQIGHQDFYVFSRSTDICKSTE